MVALESVGPVGLWGEPAPRVTRAVDPHACAAAVSMAAVESMLLGGAMVWPQARLVAPGGTLHPRHYTAPAGPWGPATVRDRLDPVAILQRVRAGCAVAWDEAHRWHPALAAWVWGLERRLSARVSANLYRTGPEGPAFAPHYDPQNIVVVQLDGRKRWRVHAPVVPWPTAAQPCPPGGVPPGPVLLDCVLKPGDLLVLPRGFVHEARALEGPSLHVSLSVLPWTRIDLARAGGPDADPAVVANRAAIWLDLGVPGGGLTDPADAAAADRLLDELVDTRQPDLVGALTDAAGIDRLTAGDTVRPRRSLSRVGLAGEDPRVVAPGRTLTFPAVALPALQAALAGPCRAGALPDLTPAESVTLARHLVAEALLTRA